MVLPTLDVEKWARSEQVGIYESLGLGAKGKLEVLVEKDFACLDLGNAENKGYISKSDCWRDLLNDLRDECVHPWPSLHRLVLRPDRELDFSVNRQTPCLGDETHRYGR